MATDPGVLDAYLSVLQAEIDRRQDDLGRVKEQLKTAKLEQAALGTLTAAATATLAAASVTGRLALPELQARRDQLQTEIQAIRDLVAAAKGVA